MAFFSPEDTDTLEPPSIPFASCHKCKLSCCSSSVQSTSRLCLWVHDQCCCCSSGSGYIQHV